jgi:hypothetical protein
MLLHVLHNSLSIIKPFARKLTANTAADSINSSNTCSLLSKGCHSSDSISWCCCIGSTCSCTCLPWGQQNGWLGLISSSCGSNFLGSRGWQTWWVSIISSSCGSLRLFFLLGLLIVLLVLPVVLAFFSDGLVTSCYCGSCSTGSCSLKCRNCPCRGIGSTCRQRCQNGFWDEKAKGNFWVAGDGTPGG